jgi:hypothetical protein
LLKYLKFVTASRCSMSYAEENDLIAFQLSLNN